MLTALILALTCAAGHLARDNQRDVVRRHDRRLQPFQQQEFGGEEPGWSSGLGCIGTRLARLAAPSICVVDRGGAARQGQRPTPPTGLLLQADLARAPWRGRHRCVDLPVDAGDPGTLDDAAALAALKPVRPGHRRAGKGTLLCFALHGAAADGRVGAAALDCFHEEPLPRERPLWALLRTADHADAAGETGVTRKTSSIFSTRISSASFVAEPRCETRWCDGGRRRRFAPPGCARRLASRNGTSDCALVGSFQCAQEFWAGLSRELVPAERESQELGSRSGRSRRLPILKRFPSKSAERIAGNEMALDVENAFRTAA